ncbi:MAG: hypothetical protein OXG04_11370 [Acidobacteria bacterium]|nr:hypothetical protein [Acidobacteriota bacterium]
MLAVDNASVRLARSHVAGRLDVWTQSMMPPASMSTVRVGLLGLLLGALGWLG